MRDYVSSLKRHVHASGPGKTLLTKNTSLAGRMESTLQALPDMRVIDIVRHPYEAIPSLLSMYDVTWKRLAPGATRSLTPHRQLAILYAGYYRQRMAMKEVLPSRQFLEVRFEDLTRDPETVLLGIYESFGMEITGEVRERLAHACSEGRSHRSRHRYSLEQFGLSEQWVFDTMPDVFDHYGFDPGGARSHGRQAESISQIETGSASELSSAAADS
jgi:hypothetical protein